ncbi:MAG: hypothetical protein ACM31G_02280 [Flavobacteriales bacterium]
MEVALIIGLCKVLSLGRFLRLILLKILHPKATLTEIESFEKNTKSNYSFRLNRKKKNKN